MLTANVVQKAGAFLARFQNQQHGRDRTFSIFEPFVSVPTGSFEENEELGRASKSRRSRGPIARKRRSHSLVMEPFLRLPQAHKRSEKGRNPARPPPSFFPLNGEDPLARLAFPSSPKENKVEVSNQRRAHLFPRKKRKGSMRAQPAKRRNRKRILVRTTSSRFYPPFSVYAQ